MIPVFINVYNRLTTTTRLAQQVATLGGRPIIVDNASTYEPLLEWYATQTEFEVIRLAENLGHHAPWHSQAVRTYRADRYVVTDCDLDLGGIPSDALAVLAEPFFWPTRQPVIKSGFALRIDDLPAWQTNVRQWEQRFWRQAVAHDPRFYWAPIDTTFAMYSGDTDHATATQVVRIKSVRLGGQYQARHRPWYCDGLNLSDEDAQYFATASDANSWKPKGQALTSRYAVR